MTNPLPAERLAYHRLARAYGRHRWWRPLLGTLVAAGGWALALLALYAANYTWGLLRGYPENPDGSIRFGPVASTAVDLMGLAAAIPAVLLAVRWIGRRPAGTVTSVAGRMRWRLLGICLLVAVPVLAAAAGVMQLTAVDDASGSGARSAEWVGWEAFGTAMAVLVVLVPLQAAAEEYVFRGWLMQSVGGFLRSPWCAVLPQAVLFAAVHGWGTAWGFADLLFFGVAAGWLTIRTGGLEAAIGLHTINNLLSFAVGAAVVDGLRSDETAADAPWQLVAVDVASIAVYVAVVLWLVARRRPAVGTLPAAPPPPASEPPRTASADHGLSGVGTPPAGGDPRPRQDRYTDGGPR
ncbi:lysostaphin resistance A-like protein [Streptomyces sp. NPDC019531]|uniref:CPBP family intramembrane glutamic endopeptidase n=1 Tax=Streptomyces sp. NPDC019531 TaxID=3365062 RepID=UPI00384AE3B7